MTPQDNDYRHKLLDVQDGLVVAAAETVLDNLCHLKAYVATVTGQGCNIKFEDTRIGTLRIATVVLDNPKYTPRWNLYAKFDEYATERKTHWYKMEHVESLIDRLDSYHATIVRNHPTSVAPALDPATAHMAAPTMYMEDAQEVQADMPQETIPLSAYKEGES